MNIVTVTGENWALRDYQAEAIKVALATGQAVRRFTIAATEPATLSRNKREGEYFGKHQGKHQRWGAEWSRSHFPKRIRSVRGLG